MTCKDDISQAATHTCKFCSQCFESFWVTKEHFFIDLATGLEAITWAKQDCTFPESSNARVQLQVSRCERYSATQGPCN